MSKRAVLIALLTACSVSILAQQPAGGGDSGKVLVLKDIVGGAVLTPEYQVKRNPPEFAGQELVPGRGRLRDQARVAG
jgi:hypothetical protein